MDITQRQITKIAREVGKFTSRMMKAEGVGTAEFDLIHVVRKRPGITQAEISKILGADKGAVAKQTANLERVTFGEKIIRQMGAASLFFLRSRPRA